MYNENKTKIKGGMIAVIALAVVLVVGSLGFAASGFRNRNFNKPEEEIPENNIVAYDENGNEMYSNKVYSMSDLTFTPMAAASNVTIQATVLPSEATNKNVDWAVEWINPSSAWANGVTVTSYVTVTPSSNGSTTATVNCLQACAEPVRVIVTSRDNPLGTADCTVNYSKKIVSGTLNVAGTQRANGAIALFASNDNTAFNLAETLNYSIFTLDDSFTKSYSMTVNKAFISYIKNSSEYKNDVVNNQLLSTTVKDAFTAVFNDLENEFDARWNGINMTNSRFSSIYSGSYGSLKNPLLMCPSNFRTFFNTALLNYSQSSGLFTVTVKFTGTHSTYNFNIHIGVADTVTSLKLDESEIVF